MMSIKLKDLLNIIDNKENINLHIYNKNEIVVVYDYVYEDIYKSLIFDNLERLLDCEVFYVYYRDNHIRSSICAIKIQILDDYGIELAKEDNEILLLTDEEFEEYCRMLEQTI